MASRPVTKKAHPTTQSFLDDSDEDSKENSDDELEEDEPWVVLTNGQRIPVSRLPPELFAYWQRHIKGKYKERCDVCNSEDNIARCASSNKSLCETCWEDQMVRTFQKKMGGKVVANRQFSWTLTPEERKQAERNPGLVEERGRFINAVQETTPLLRGICQLVVGMAVALVPGVYNMTGYHQGQNNVKYMADGFIELHPDHTIGGSLFSEVINKECPLYDGSWSYDANEDANIKFGYIIEGEGSTQSTRFKGTWKHPNATTKTFNTDRFHGNSFFVLSYNNEKTDLWKEKQQKTTTLSTVTQAVSRGPCDRCVLL